MNCVYLSKGYWEKSIWHDISIVTLKYFHLECYEFKTNFKEFLQKSSFLFLPCFQLLVLWNVFQHWLSERTMLHFLWSKQLLTRQWHSLSIFLNDQIERQWHCLQLKSSNFCQGSPFQIHIDHQCIYATSKRPSIKLLSCECSLRSKILFGKRIQIFWKEQNKENIEKDWC